MSFDSYNDSDSDAPEEITTQQGIEQVQEIRRAEKENVIRVAKEGKERRRQRAQRKVPEKSGSEVISDVAPCQDAQVEEDELERPNIPGMLPSHIVKYLAEREKQLFPLDAEEETDKVHVKHIKKKKRQKSSGPETVLLKDLPQAQCAQNSMEFLKKRKMQVPRSTAVLKNANQALRLLTAKGSLLG